MKMKKKKKKTSSYVTHETSSPSPISLSFPCKGKTVRNGSNSYLDLVRNGSNSSAEQFGVAPITSEAVRNSSADQLGMAPIHAWINMGGWSSSWRRAISPVHTESIEERFQFYLTESVFKVVLQKSIPAQIFQLIIHCYSSKSVNLSFIITNMRPSKSR